MMQLTYAAQIKTASQGSCKNAPSGGAHFQAQLHILNPNHGKGRVGTNTPLLPHQVGEKCGLKEAMSRAGEPVQALSGPSADPHMFVTSDEETHLECLQA